MSTATCHPNSKVCDCGHLMPRSRVSHMTAPAGPLPCLHVCTSKIGFLQTFCSLRHLPSQTPSAQKSVTMMDRSSSTSRPSPSMKSESDTDSFLRRRSQEKISFLRESKLFQSILVPSSNSRTFRRSPSGPHDVEFLRFWSSNISCLQCLLERRITKQRRETEVYTLQR